MSQIIRPKTFLSQPLSIISKQSTKCQVSLLLSVAEELLQQGIQHQERRQNLLGHRGDRHARLICSQLPEDASRGAGSGREPVLGAQELGLRHLLRVSAPTPLHLCSESHHPSAQVSPVHPASALQDHGEHGGGRQRGDGGVRAALGALAQGERADGHPTGGAELCPPAGAAQREHEQHARTFGPHSLHFFCSHIALL